MGRGGDGTGIGGVRVEGVGEADMRGTWGRRGVGERGGRGRNGKIGVGRKAMSVCGCEQSVFGEGKG